MTAPPPWIDLLAGTLHRNQNHYHERRHALKAMMPVTNPTHLVDPAPVGPALFTQLVEWALDGRELSPSIVPTDCTLVPVCEVLARFATLFVDAALPDASALPYVSEVDLEDAPLPLPLPLPTDKRLPSLASAVESRGNELAGIRLTEVELGGAAFTGWNPWRHIAGLPDVLVDPVGCRIALGAEPPIAEALRAVALGSVKRRLLLERDVEAVVEAAIRSNSA